MYNENSKKANVKYLKNKQKRVSLNWQKEDFENRVLPAIKKSGTQPLLLLKRQLKKKSKEKIYKTAAAPAH